MIKQNSVFDLEFKKYGRVIDNYDLKEIIDVANKETPCPSNVEYVPSVKCLEELSIYEDLKNGIYGQMPIQIGYCNGHNNKLNALEYHRDSEINIAINDMILLLAKKEELKDDYSLDTSLVKAFLVPKGTMVEIYADTLHYAPCDIANNGFKCVVVLPKGTNEQLSDNRKIINDEDKLLTAKNKWLIGHKDGGLPKDSFIGLIGENIEI